MPPAVAVGSSVYNLAGEPDRRPDMLKSQVIAQMTGVTPLCIGESIIRGYGGTGAFRMRQFLKWSKTDPDFLARIGVTSGSLPAGNLDFDLILEHTPPWDEDEEVTLILPTSTYMGSSYTTHVGSPDPSMWVLQFMTRYYYNEDYTYVFDPVTELATISRDGETDIVLHLVDYYPGQTYLYVRYLTNHEEGLSLAAYWWIYRYGGGDLALDAMIEGSHGVALGSFYPPIPFRYENDPVTADSPNLDLVDLYPTCKKAFRKAFGTNFDDAQDKILDEGQNPNIGDIDFIYAVSAVTFNTQEQAGRKYIFMFMQYLVDNTVNPSEAGKANWFIQWEAGAWPDGGPPWKSIKVESMITGVSNYRTDLKWVFMNSSEGSGLLKPDAKVDEVWFEATDVVVVRPFPVTYDFLGFAQEVTLCWQVTKDSWKKIVVTGLQYNNYVYRTDHTVVTAKDALEHEGDSEFLVPMHEDIFDSLPFVDSIQVGSSSSWLVFNCYEVDKEDWYETGWFRILVIAAIVVISVAVAVATGGASLGPEAAALAGALTGAGLSLTIAVIIAAAVEVLAGILLAYIIGLVSTAVFGEKWGPLIGAIVGFVFSFGTNFSSISDAVNALGRPETWIALATATGNGVSGYLQGQAMQVAEDTAKMLEDMSKQTAEVQRKYNELTGGSASGIDLSVITQYTSELMEKSSDFLSRTLVTGSDIVEITLKQIEDFTRNNIRLKPV
jgi:hypothetical protein